MKTHARGIVRQGDVLLVPVDSVPKNAVRQEVKGESLIVQEGEVTGHHHAVRTGDCTLYTLEATGTTDAVERFLSVNRATVMTHQEHSALIIAPGDYEVRIQREYAPEEIHQVAD